MNENALGKLHQSFSALKTNAQSEKDISSWFNQNFTAPTDYYGGTRPLKTSFLLESNLFLPEVSKTSTHAVYGRLIDETVETGTVLHDFLNSISKPLPEEDAIDDGARLELVLHEWSFIVAHIAVRYALPSVWDNYTEHQRNDGLHFLDTYLPKHFPGLSSKLLRNLYACGILEEKQLWKMPSDLFALRGSFGLVTDANSVRLPDNLGDTHRSIS